jgi:hypothetical protein
MANNAFIGTDNKTCNQVGDEILQVAKMVAVCKALDGSGSVAECSMLSKMDKDVWPAWQRSRVKDWPWGMWSTPQLYIVRDIDAGAWKKFLKFHPKEITTKNLTIDGHHKAWINSLFKPYKRLGQARLRPIKGSSPYSPMEMLNRGIPWPENLENTIRFMFGSENLPGVFGGSSPHTVLSAAIARLDRILVTPTTESNNSIFSADNIAKKSAELLLNMKDNETLTQGDVVTYFYEFLHGKSLGDVLPDDVPYEVISPFQRLEQPELKFESFIANNVPGEEQDLPEVFSNNIYFTDNDPNNNIITSPILVYTPPIADIPIDVPTTNTNYYTIDEGGHLFVSFTAPNNSLGEVLDSWIYMPNNAIYHKVYDEFRIMDEPDPYINKWLFYIGGANTTYGNTADMLINIKTDHVLGPKYNNRWDTSMSDSLYTDGRSVITYEPLPYQITLFEPNKIPQVNDIIDLCLNDDKIYRNNTHSTLWVAEDNANVVHKEVIFGYGLPANTIGLTDDLWVDTNTLIMYGPRDYVSDWSNVETIQLPMHDVIYCVGMPNTAVGNETDLCVDIANKVIYGPKTANNIWPSTSNTFSFNRYSTLTFGITEPSNTVIQTESFSDMWVDILTNKMYIKGESVWEDTLIFVEGTDRMLHGVGIPGDGSGIDGDYYYNTTNGIIYGPKVNGSWEV